DFMPPKGKASDVMRIVVGVEGRVRMRTELVIRLDYGTTVPWVTRLDDGTLRAIAGPQMLLLKTPVPIHGEDLKTISEFAVEAGDQLPFVLTCALSHMSPPKLPDAFAALDDTERFWREWSATCKGAGRWSK